MPVKIWDKRNGQLTNSVATSRGDSYRGERYRPDAEALDEEIDRMLDRAVELSDPHEECHSLALFVRRWAIGRALAESRLLESKHLEAGEHHSLWLAIAKKCRFGVRANGTLEERWSDLIPRRESEPSRIARDVFAVSLWLQEQELCSASMAFGGRFTNAEHLFNRESLRSLKMRDTLTRWMQGQPPGIRQQLSSTEWFMRLTKALAARFPSRGSGSAKRPMHYPVDELYEEIRRVLDPVAAELIALR